MRGLVQFAFLTSVNTAIIFLEFKSQVPNKSGLSNSWAVQMEYRLEKYEIRTVSRIYNYYSYYFFAVVHFVDDTN